MRTTVKQLRKQLKGYLEGNWVFGETVGQRLMKAQSWLNEPKKMTDFKVRSIRKTFEMADYDRRIDYLTSPQSETYWAS